KRFRVTIRFSVEDPDGRHTAPGTAFRSGSAESTFSGFTAGACGDHEIVYRIYRDAAGTQTGVRSFDDADRSHISIGFAIKDQDLIALRYENFAVHSINGDGLRVLEPGVRTKNLPHRRHITIGVTTECQDGEG